MKPVQAFSLDDIVRSMLEGLAFMLDDGAGAAPRSDGRWLRGQVGYNGVERGVLRCWCSEGFAAALSANLLGLNSGDEVDPQDALREYLNVVCGHIVTERFGPAEVFDLTIPTVETNAAGPPAVGREGYTCWLTVDSQPLFCELEVAE